MKHQVYGHHGQMIFLVPELLTYRELYCLYLTRILGIIYCNINFVNLFLYVMKMSWHGSAFCMGLLPDTQNCGLRMRQVCQERFPRYQLQRKPLVSDPVMHVGIAYLRWRGKRSRHSLCMRNTQFCVHGKRPITGPVYAGSTCRWKFPLTKARILNV